jgi:hypothetical protein
MFVLPASAVEPSKPGCGILLVKGYISTLSCVNAWGGCVCKAGSVGTDGTQSVEKIEGYPPLAIAVTLVPQRFASVGQ